MEGTSQLGVPESTLQHADRKANGQDVIIELLGLGELTGLGGSMSPARQLYWWMVNHRVVTQGAET